MPTSTPTSDSIPLFYRSRAPGLRNIAAATDPAPEEQHAINIIRPTPPGQPPDQIQARSLPYFNTPATSGITAQNAFTPEPQNQPPDLAPIVANLVDYTRATPPSLRDFNNRRQSLHFYLDPAQAQHDAAQQQVAQHASGPYRYERVPGGVDEIARYHDGSETRDRIATGDQDGIVRSQNWLKYHDHLTSQLTDTAQALVPLLKQKQGLDAELQVWQDNQSRLARAHHIRSHPQGPPDPLPYPDPMLQIGLIDPPHTMYFPGATDLHGGPATLSFEGAQPSNPTAADSPKGPGVSNPGDPDSPPSAQPQASQADDPPSPATASPKGPGISNPADSPPAQQQVSPPNQLPPTDTALSSSKARARTNLQKILADIAQAIAVPGLDDTKKAALQKRVEFYSQKLAEHQDPVPAGTEPAPPSLTTSTPTTPPPDLTTPTQTTQPPEGGTPIPEPASQPPQPRQTQAADAPPQSQAPSPAPKDPRARKLRELEHQGYAGIVNQIRGLDAEREQRRAEVLRQNNNDPTSPGAQTALSAIDADISQREQAIRQSAPVAQQKVQKLYQDWGSKQNIIDWRTTDELGPELTDTAAKLGLDEKDLRYWLDYYRRADWDQPLNTDAREGHLQHAWGGGVAGLLGYDTIPEKVRLLPDGAPIVNPLLHGDRQAFEKAVDDAPVTRAQKDALKAQFPALHRQWAASILPTLVNEASVPFTGPTFSQWHNQKSEESQAGKNKDGFLSLPVEDQVLRYVDEMKARGVGAKYFDAITRNFIKGGGDLVTAGLGLTSLALGKVPGIGKPISEAAADWSETNDGLTTAIATKGGADSFGLRLSGGLAALLAQAGTSGVGRTLGGTTKAIMLLSGAQAAGQQFSQTYATLRANGMNHDDAWNRVAPLAIATGLVNAAAAGFGSKGGFETLMRKGDPAALGQALQPVWKNFFKGAVNDTLQQVPTQLVTQISAAIAANPNGDPAAIAADTTATFIKNSPDLIATVALAGGLSQAGKTQQDNQVRSDGKPTPNIEGASSQTPAKESPPLSENRDAQGKPYTIEGDTFTDVKPLTEGSVTGETQAPSLEAPPGSASEPPPIPKDPAAATASEASPAQAPEAPPTSDAAKPPQTESPPTPAKSPNNTSGNTEARQGQTRADLTARNPDAPPVSESSATPHQEGPQSAPATPPIAASPAPPRPTTQASAQAIVRNLAKVQTVRPLNAYEQQGLRQAQEFLGQKPAIRAGTPSQIDGAAEDPNTSSGDLPADNWWEKMPLRNEPPKRGSFGGELYDTNQLDPLEKDEMIPHGVKLNRGADEFLARGGIAAGFQAVGPGKGIMHLKENPTRREVLHEMVHLRQFKELGYEKYQELRKSGRHEMGVMEWFNEHPEEWNRLNADEKAAEYLNYNKWKDKFDAWKQQNEGQNQ